MVEPKLDHAKRSSMRELGSRAEARHQSRPAAGALLRRAEIANFDFGYQSVGGDGAVGNTVEPSAKLSTKLVSV